MPDPSASFQSIALACMQARAFPYGAIKIQKQDYRFFSWLAMFEMAATLLCAIGSWFDGIDGLALIFLLFSIFFLAFKTSLDNDAAKQH